MRNWIVFLMMAVTANAWAAELSDTNQEKSQKAQDIWSGDKALGCKPLPTADATKIGIIRQMLDSGRPHAAIAYLDAAKSDVPQAELLRAHALRQTGREDDAAVIYKRLTSSCLIGYAYQGLGLISANRHDLPQSIEQLRIASKTLPVDAAIRNDFGYVLMLDGQNEHALHEFLTAIELAPEHRQAAFNLLLLLYRSGQSEKAKAFADQFGIVQADLDKLQIMATQALPQSSMSPATTILPGTAPKETP